MTSLVIQFIYTSASVNSMIQKFPSQGEQNTTTTYRLIVSSLVVPICFVKKYLLDCSESLYEGTGKLQEKLGEEVVGQKFKCSIMNFDVHTRWHNHQTPNSFPIY